jgi:hypothetical protein
MLSKILWAKTPQMALLYDDVEEALCVSQDFEKSCVVVLFDVGDRISVSMLSGPTLVK